MIEPEGPPAPEDTPIYDALRKHYDAKEQLEAYFTYEDTLTLQQLLEGAHLAYDGTKS